MFTTPSVYIAIAIIALAAIALFFIFLLKKQGKGQPSKLAYVAMGLVLLSMLFDERLPAYSLIGLGVVLAITDIVMSLKKNRES
jgi:drug/metabolite transporter (DMT)-like permease